MNNIKTRINEILKRLNLSNNELAKILEIDQPSFSKIKNGKLTPYNYIPNFMKININLNWLFSGEGEMLNPVILDQTKKYIVDKIYKMEFNEGVLKLTLPFVSAFFIPYHQYYKTLFYLDSTSTKTNNTLYFIGIEMKDSFLKKWIENEIKKDRYIFDNHYLAYSLKDDLFGWIYLSKIKKEKCVVFENNQILKKLENLNDIVIIHSYNKKDVIDKYLDF